MSFTDRFLKPEYWFQPRQVLRRFGRRGPRPAEAEVVTPWGLPMRVRPHETVGHALWHLGILDLAACEACWRLLDPGETAVDVGANIGVMTGLLARRAGPTGEVWSFEPHPEIGAELARHVGRWQREGQPLAKLQIHTAALSNVAGEAALFEPRCFAGNRGSASLETVSSETGAANAASGRSFTVPTQTFDTVFPPARRVGVFKIDVEGHEPRVFAGAAIALGERRVRDIVFEEHHALPSPTSALLSAAGYTLFFLGRTFWGPRLTPPADRSSQPSWLPPNYLATLEPDRALARCRARGWQVLA